MRGKTAIVTGATSGIGFETARELARAGARVILASRNPGKGVAAVGAIRADIPEATVRFEALDLANLRSIRAFAGRMHQRGEPVALLVNNAGLMMMPTRQTTEDGFELQFGVNHLGHFALTAQLWPLIGGSGGARIVTIASVAHRRGRMRFDDLNSTRSYRPLRAYSQTKLANLLFMLELQRRIEQAGADVISVAAHPGHTATDLFRTGRGGGGLRTTIGDYFFRAIGQSAAMGALPTLHAGLDPDVRGGSYFGPRWFREFYGRPAPATLSRHALDEADGKRLWEESERLTGVTFDVTAA